VQPASQTSPPPRPRSPLIRIAVLALVFAIALFVAHRLGWLNYRSALVHVEGLRASHSFPVFAIVFVVAAGFGMAVGFPGLPFVVAAGALFGTALGSALGWAASMLGAVIGYWIARTIGHDVVLRWVRHSPRVSAAVAESHDFAAMLRIRLIPVLPIGIVNFIAGLARVPFTAYLVSTALGIVPATVIYAYFADSLLKGVGGGRREALTSLAIASALLVALSLTPTASRWWRRRESRARPRPKVPSHPHPSRRP
jgi:uncharacterized membrane protein YdjX (TVP38/TMEM64 family)